MVTRSRLVVVLLMLLFVVGFGLVSCLNDSTDDPLVAAGEEGEEVANPAFAGTFSGTFTGTLGGPEFVDTMAMVLRLQSPLSGTFLAGNGADGTLAGTIAGEVEGDSATVTMTIEELDNEEEMEHEHEDDMEHEEEMGHTHGS